MMICRPLHTEKTMFGILFVLGGLSSILSGVLTIAQHSMGWWWLLAGTGIVMGALFVFFRGRMALRAVADVVHERQVIAQ